LSASIAEQLRQRLVILQPEQLEIADESARHAGHAGSNGGAHFHLFIVSPVFAGLARINRHRKVQEAAGDLMNGAIHALSIVAKAPGEV
jgi:BolA protein